MQVNSCCSPTQSCPKKRTPTAKPRSRSVVIITRLIRLAKSMVFLSHSSYRCWWQMFRSCWKALDGCWRSLRTSLCQSQLHEMLHTPHSPDLHSEISSPTAPGSELWQLTDQVTPPSHLCMEPLMSGFAQTREVQECWGGQCLPSHTLSHQKGVTRVCVTGAGNKSWLGPQQTLALWHPVGDLVTLVVPTRQQCSSCLHLPHTVAGARGLVQRLDISDTSAKSKPELAAVQGFILLMSHLCQLELVIEEGLQKWYHKCWRDWERHVWRKQELQSCGRTCLTFVVWEKTWCGLLQHSLPLPQMLRDC